MTVTDDPDAGWSLLRQRKAVPSDGAGEVVPTLVPGQLPFITIAFLLLLGYLVMGRSFAQIGLAPVNVFLGEVALTGIVAYRPTRQVLMHALDWLTRPHPLHLVTFAFVILLGYGVFEVALGVKAGYGPLEAAKNLAFNYYPILLFVGLAVGSLDRSFLSRLNVVLPWLNVGYVLVFLLVLRNVRIQVPFSATPTMTPGSATLLVTALMVTMDKPPGRRWYLLVANIFCLVFLQIRGDWFGMILGVGLWATLTRRWRHLAVAGALTIAGLGFVSVMHITIPGAGGRGGGVSIDQVVARAVAPFDKDLAAKYSDDVENFAGTAQWRTEWWKGIWTSVNSNDGTRIFGHAYGYQLTQLASFLQGTDAALRTPHSVFFYALGYTGWLGVLLFAFIHASVLFALWRVYLQTDNPLGLMIWVMATASALFGNFFETPYNAAPYWFLIGLILAPLVRAELVAVMTDGRVSIGSNGQRPVQLDAAGEAPIVAADRATSRVDSPASVRAGRRSDSRRRMGESTIGDAGPAEGDDARKPTASRVELRRAAHAGRAAEATPDIRGAARDDRQMPTSGRAEPTLGGADVADEEAVDHVPEATGRRTRRKWRT